MMRLASGIYGGEVVHKRVKPIEHKLRYEVFSLLVDVDELDAISDRLRLFSHNGFNLVAINDRDHGDGATPLGAYLRKLARDAGYAHLVSSYKMLCYPRMLGFGFNPLTTYFGLDRDGVPMLMIYEVSNTFGQRQTYVIPVDQFDWGNGTLSQACAKSFFVSPFNHVEGQYLFHVRDEAGDLTLGVALKTEGTALLRAHFRGQHQSLNDGAMARAVLRFGWVSVKTVFGIHFEALKLWIRGLRLVPQPRTPKIHVQHVESARAHRNAAE